LLSKRLIASIFVKDGIVVKSHGYKFWRPAGHLATALLNLDRWAVDEIIVVDISRQGKISKETLKEISKAKISTPLVYGGGIRSLNDVHDLLNAGCDRIMLESLLYGNDGTLQDICNTVGKQALIASLPLSARDGIIRGNFTSNDHLLRDSDSLSHPLDKLWNHYRTLPVSEILITDADNEGNYGYFSSAISSAVLARCTDPEDKDLIWFGGLGANLPDKLLTHTKTVGVVYGNANFEHELQMLKIRKLLRHSTVSNTFRNTGFL
jgi:cyclase